MKRIKVILILFLAFLSSLNISYAQNKLKDAFSRPLELLNDNFKNSPRIPGILGNYAPLPYPYSNINVSSDTFPQNEPSVKFNAKYPNRVVAAWRDFRTGVNPAVRRIGYSYSTNEGITWSESNLIPIDPNHPTSSDPVVVSDTAGNFYIATISITSTGNLDIVIFKSTDGGVTFPLFYMAQGGAPNLEDKEWMVCDLTKGNSPYKNSLYISWTRFVNGVTSNIFLTKSTNSGVNWSAPVQISTSSNVQGSVPYIGPNGEINVVWVRYSVNDFIVNYSKSTDGGTNFTTPIIISQGTAPDIPISSSGISFPSIACDVSGGQRNGWLYTAFCDSRNGDPDIFLSRSTNGGDNWSSPIRVNNDALGNGKLQCWSWITVNDSGKIAILFYDSRNTTNNTVVEAWLARSNDGGQTFINEKISSIPSPTGEPNSDVRYGDYINLDYSGNRIIPVWTDMRTGAYNQEIYSANIDLSIGINQISKSIPDKSELMQNYPNPFNPRTTIKFSINEPGFVSLKVYDILGKEITSLVNKILQPGLYEVPFSTQELSDYHISSGVYFYRMTINNSSISTKTMVLTK
jgi:hypothetical protein